MVDNIRTGFLLLFSRQTVGYRAPFCICFHEPAPLHTNLAFSSAGKPLQLDFAAPHMYTFLENLSQNPATELK